MRKTQIPPGPSRLGALSITHQCPKRKGIVENAIARCINAVCLLADGSESERVRHSSGGEYVCVCGKPCYQGKTPVSAGLLVGLKQSDGGNTAELGAALEESNL